MTPRSQIFKLWLFALSLIASPLSASAAEEVALTSYHGTMPFADTGRQGLTYDLADYLTAKSKGTYRFTVHITPKKRIHHLLDNGEQLIVPWSNPAWFRDSQRTAYLWSLPMVHDRNELISLKSKPFEYNGPESLNGKDLLGIRGYFYTGIDPLVNAGKINRYDANSHEASLQMLLADRTDVLIIQSMSARSLIHQRGLADNLYFSQTPHSTYDRYFLVTKGKRSVLLFLNQTLRDMVTDPDWGKVLAKYGLEDLRATKMPED